MLNLPNVTLVAVETQCHELARLTLTDMVTRINFGGVLVYTNDPAALAVPGAKHISVPNWPDKSGQGTFYYKEAGADALTSHVLKVEWDAGLRDPNAWTDDFLAYDYIGAPWPGMRYGGWDPAKDYTVGNGGFSLWSTRLCRAVQAQPLQRMATDLHICKANRDLFIKQIGAVWAPESIAYRFSFEHGNPEQREQPSFGYHDVFNWHLALDRDEIMRRAHLLMQNNYIATRTPKLHLLARENPWLLDAIPEFRTAIGHYRGPVPGRPGLVPPPRGMIGSRFRAPHPRLVAYRPGVKA